MQLKQLELDLIFDEEEDNKYNDFSTYYVYMKTHKKIGVYGKQCGNVSKVLLDGHFTDDEIREISEIVYNYIKEKK